MHGGGGGGGGVSHTVYTVLPLLLVMLACRVNHGVATMYEFAEEAGGMERSRYFGFSKGDAAQAAAAVVWLHKQQQALVYCTH
jgi:hypothetical protein